MSETVPEYVPRRSAHAIYCDDVRIEINQKIFHIGVYAADLYVVQTPVTLPSLSVILEIYSPDARPFKKLRVVGTFAGEQVVELLLGEKELADAENALEAVREDSREWKANFDAKDDSPLMRMFAFHLTLSPFEIKTEGALRLSVIIDEEEELRPRTLRIRARNSPSEEAKTTKAEL